MNGTSNFSLEAEEAVLSCCLNDGGETLSACIKCGVNSETFYDSKHRIVFDCAEFLIKNGKPVEPHTIAEELKRTNQLEEVGGYPFLTQITATEPTTARAAYFIEKVRDLATRRKMEQDALEMNRALRDGTRPTAAIIEEWGGRLSLTHTASPAPASCTIWSPRQFLAFRPDPEAAILGDGYLESGEWTSLVGIGGIGKTRLALWLCVCQILGRDFCGIRTQKAPKKWLFLSTENGLRRWQTDFRKMLGPLSEEERAAVDTNLRLLALTDDDDGDLNLGDDLAVNRLAATLKAESPGGVIFDPFCDMVDGDESKTCDLVSTLRILRKLHRKHAPSAAVLIVHHARTGKNNVAEAGDNFSSGNFGRGSKVLYSRVRCEIQLAPGDRDDPSKLLLACGKANNCEKFTTRGLLFNADDFSYTVDPDFDLERWRAAVSGGDSGESVTEIEVAQVVSSLAPCTGDEAKFKAILEAIKEDREVSERTVRSRLREAVKRGYLRDGKLKGSYRLGSEPIPK